MNALGLLNAQPLSTLQERVRDMGMCPYCHSKTLHEKYNSGQFRFDQCSQCRAVFCVEQGAGSP